MAALFEVTYNYIAKGYSRPVTGTGADNKKTVKANDAEHVVCKLRRHYRKKESSGKETEFRVEDIRVKEVKFVTCLDVL